MIPEVEAMNLDFLVRDEEHDDDVQDEDQLIGRKRQRVEESTADHARQDEIMRRRDEFLRE